MAKDLHSLHPMKNANFILFFLIGSLGLLGCSESGSSGGDPGVSYYTAKTYAGLDTELKNADFSCANANACPSNVGLIYSNIDGSNSQPKLGQCTGFLISDDIVATNSHCIPDRLKVPGAQCNSQIAIRFLGNSGKKNIFTCKQILEYSPDGTFDPDYAFFKVESTGISPLPIYKEGLSDNQEVSSVKVTPLTNKRGGRLEIENCKIALGTLLNLKGATPWSQTAVALGCEAIPGNSGSPVLNRHGEVVGIMQSKITNRYVKIIEDNFKAFKMVVPDPLSRHALLTNLSCVKDPISGLSNEENCKRVENITPSHCTEFDNEKTQENGRQLEARWKESLPSLLVYDYVLEEGQSIIQATPVCVKSKGQSPDYEKYISLQGLIGFRKPHLSLYYPKSLAFSSRMTLDSEYRINPEMGFVEEARTEFSLDLIKEGDRWNGTTNSTYSGGVFVGDLTQMKIPLSLTDCTEAQITAKEILKIKMKDGQILTEDEYKLRQVKTDKKLCSK